MWKEQKITTHVSEIIPTGQVPSELKNSSSPMIGVLTYYTKERRTLLKIVFSSRSWWRERETQEIQIVLINGIDTYLLMPSTLHWLWIKHISDGSDGYGEGPGNGWREKWISFFQNGTPELRSRYVSSNISNTLQRKLSECRKLYSQICEKLMEEIERILLHRTNSDRDLNSVGIPKYVQRTAMQELQFYRWTQSKFKIKPLSYWREHVSGIKHYSNARQIKIFETKIIED